MHFTFIITLCSLCSTLLQDLRFRQVPLRVKSMRHQSPGRTEPSTGAAQAYSGQDHLSLAQLGQGAMGLGSNRVNCIHLGPACMQASVFHHRSCKQQNIQCLRQVIMKAPVNSMYDEHHPTCTQEVQEYMDSPTGCDCLYECNIYVTCVLSHLFHMMYLILLS